MLFRHLASLVDAVHLDGSDATYQAALALPRATRAPQGIEVQTSCGRRLARRGCWITRDSATSAVRVHEHAAFLAAYEAVA